VELAELHLRVAEAVHRHVDGDVDAQLLGELPLVADDILLAEVRAAGGEAHGDEPPVVAQVLAADAARLVAVDALDAAGVVGPEPPVLDRCVREAEGEHGAQAGILESLDRGIGMLWRVHDVRPVNEGGDARVDALKRPPQVAGVHVIGPIVRCELVEDGAEVGAQRVVRGARPDRGLPGMPMGVDEAGDHDIAIGLDHPGAIRAQAPADPGDLVALDEDVRARHLAELTVLAQHDSAADQDSVGHEFGSFL
jgi:hypothetical protein